MPKYSKFRGLEYIKGYDSNSFWEQKLNSRFKEILEKSALYASNFAQMNDIDEFRYAFFHDCNISADQKMKIFEQIQMMRCIKDKFYLTSFSRYCKYEKDYLMWANYANGSLGARIDFTISNENRGLVVPVQYRDYFPAIDIKNIQIKDLKEVMSTKNICWGYEREHRAIFNNKSFEELNKEEKHYFPIQIESITLGRGICQENLIYDELDETNISFDRHAIKVAKFIYEVLKNTQKYSSKTPKIYAFKTKYSPEAVEITQEELEG
ncbi:hypothetical protein OFO10_02160 [Campylobacter sp. VBCF_06 NA8]|uniref:hypothetical protein n=1 Tax=Campylobacter sp. VBCF_06 NA8 TaxID=2983822 RepID=UPI0022E9D858|nr:hypothetical protein [Campylobacter sp. VBCF_06 NA8]MDA3045959.1 hypothetical protein [Campylobacter sp. VBCF_06 NA8]